MASIGVKGVETMTDNQLLRRLRAHDQDALVQLNDRYYDYLCAVIMQIREFDSNTTEKMRKSLV